MKILFGLTGSIALGAASVIVLLSAGGQPVAAQQFDLNAYKALVDASSPETVPLGTHITLQNWQQYRNFFGIADPGQRLFK